MPPVSFCATVKAKKGSEDALKAAIIRTIHASRVEPGLISVVAQEHTDDPGRISVFEVYKDAKALELHEATEYQKALFLAFEELAEGGVQSVHVAKGTPLV